MNLELLNIPTSKINQFKYSGIKSIEDLARYIPKKYIDFRKKTLIKNLTDGKVEAIVATVLQKYNFNKSVFSIMVKDESNTIMFITWFHMPYLSNKINIGQKYFFGGKVKIEQTNKGLKRTMINPMFNENIKESLNIFPIYKRIRYNNKKTNKITYMSDSFLKKSINSAIALIGEEDYLESSILNKFKLLPMGECFRKIHFPKNIEDYKKSKTRLLFDDLFFFNFKLLEIQQKNIKNININSCVMDKYDLVNKFIKTLPFELTKGQKNVCHIILEKIRSKNMTLNALIQGDVGTGKTIVAMIALLTAINSGYQGVLIAPTLILAKQHYNEIKNRFKEFNINISLLTGETKTKDRKHILQELKDGTINLIISTHAIISEKIKFNNLGMIIVDEEHKFGVLQRNFLKQNNKNGVHFISLSATPIPRSLSMAIYGDNIDILTIKTKPKNRKNIITKISSKKQSYEFIRKEIYNGRQCYIVCPYIDINKDNIDSIESTYKEVCSYFKNDKKIKPAIITGKMKKEESNKIINDFSNNKTNILISTTIIEVGINIPNATIMLIKNAERFGLSQLHQLRGRVGRGEYQSYCILESSKEIPRLKVLCNTNDGFKIAEEDLKERGPGDFIGTKQSGNNKYVMLMLAYKKYNEYIKNEVIKIFKDTKRFKRYKYLLLKQIDF